MKDKIFYITVPIFYPNAELHLGNVYPVVIADILARYHRIIGDKTYFLTGADENTSKVIKAASELGKDPKKHLDDIVGSFQNLFTEINSSHDQFIRTSDNQAHWPGAIALWNKLVESGDIEKRKYSGLYCVACEAFYTEKDLIEGRCQYHHTVPELIEEENYFFLLSKYTDKVRNIIEGNEMIIIPQTRKNEILSVLKEGLQDISFSRPKAKVPWGIPVPGDDSQVMYVWCDALSNYISALGYGTDNDDLFKTFWPTDAHVLGKDILRFHAAIWPAMLLSAGIPVPKRLVVHGLILSNGKKMSKSLGNTISPKELIEEYGAEALRLYIAKEISLFEDGELTKESFKAAYNANLANGLGNLVSRVMKMAETNLDAAVDLPSFSKEGTKGWSHDVFKSFEDFNIQQASNLIWKQVQMLDQKIQETQPFKLVKTDKEAGVNIIKGLVQEVYNIALALSPILPETSEKIKALVLANKSPETPLFVRKD
jgi:methionyl-tRNA synthetase